MIAPSGRESACASSTGALPSVMQRAVGFRFLALLLAVVAGFAVPASALAHGWLHEHARITMPHPPLPHMGPRSKSRMLIIGTITTRSLWDSSRRSGIGLPSESAMAR